MTLLAHLVHVQEDRNPTRLYFVIDTIEMVAFNCMSF